jgi:rubrerythrin
MEQSIAEALRTAICIEKNSFDFYRRAAELVSDERTRQVFEFLAGEEAEHMEAFLGMYPGNYYGDLLRLPDQSPDLDHQVNGELFETIGPALSAEQALEISLREEMNCLDLYSGLCRNLSDPRLREVFEQALDDTHTHCKVIDEEWMRIMRMTARSGKGR